MAAVKIDDRGIVAEAVGQKLETVVCYLVLAYVQLCEAYFALLQVFAQKLAYAVIQVRLLQVDLQESLVGHQGSPKALILVPLYLVLSQDEHLEARVLGQRFPDQLDVLRDI